MVNNTTLVYFLERRSDKAIKIGTTKNLKVRIRRLEKDHGELKLLGIIKGGYVREKLLHWIFEGRRLDGEFFQPDNELKTIIEKYAVLPEVPESKRVNGTMYFKLASYLSHLEELERMEQGGNRRNVPTLAELSRSTGITYSSLSWLAKGRTNSLGFEIATKLLDELNRRGFQTTPGDILGYIAPDGIMEQTQ